MAKEPPVGAGASGLEARVSGQLESRHFFRDRDTVERVDGRVGTVVSGHALYATIAWMDGDREEVEQFDPAVVVVERAENR
jgi:hypothetical protein